MDCPHHVQDWDFTSDKAICTRCGTPVPDDWTEVGRETPPEDCYQQCPLCNLYYLSLIFDPDTYGQSICDACWDKQIIEDAKSGALDKLTAKDL